MGSFDWLSMKLLLSGHERNVILCSCDELAALQLLCWFTIDGICWWDCSCFCSIYKIWTFLWSVKNWKLLYMKRDIDIDPKWSYILIQAQIQSDPLSWSDRLASIYRDLIVWILCDEMQYFFSLTRRILPEYGFVSHGRYSGICGGTSY